MSDPAPDLAPAPAPRRGAAQAALFSGLVLAS